MTWTLIIGGGALLYIFLGAQMYLGFRSWWMPIGWGEARLWAVPDFLIWALLIPYIVWFSRHTPLDRRTWLRAVLVHLAAAAAFSFFALWLRYGFEAATDWSRGAPNLLTQGFFRMGISFPSGIMLYWTVLGVDHALRYYGKFREGELKAAQLEAQLARAQLEALQMQLHPHFLFNTLNSIAVLMRKDVDAASRMLTRLSDLLRITLESTGTQLVPLKHELDLLHGYLEIQQTRFRDRLRVEFSIDPEVLDARVPNLILQPLVENAIRHGIAPRATPGRVQISADRDDGMLCLGVRDDGPGLSRTAKARGRGGTGIGLSNTRERLQKLYGADHRFELRNAEEGGLAVMLTIPLDTRWANGQGQEENAGDPSADRR